MKGDSLEISPEMKKLIEQEKRGEIVMGTVVTLCCLFIEVQGIYIEGNLFKDNAFYMCDVLVTANAIFADIRDLRKPEYLYCIVEDVLEQGREMRKAVCGQLEEVGFSATEKMDRQMKTGKINFQTQ